LSLADAVEAGSTAVSSFTGAASTFWTGSGSGGPWWFANSSIAVLAYVGASLPILLLFSAADLEVSDALNLEMVAKEVVATLVGSTGLIAAVPITPGSPRS
jgi:hypothetical protein